MMYSLIYPRDAAGEKDFECVLFAWIKNFLNFCDTEK